MRIRSMIEMGEQNEKNRDNSDADPRNEATKDFSSLDSSRNSRRAPKCENNNSSIKEIYRTIDCIALKRKTLPLQLLPIDENSFEPSNESNRKNATSNPPTTARKSSTRRPSFKVRSPVSLGGASGQWKSLNRGQAKPQAISSKFEVSKQRSTSNFERKKREPIAEAGTDDAPRTINKPEYPETTVNREEGRHSEVNQPEVAFAKVPLERSCDEGDRFEKSEFARGEESKGSVEVKKKLPVSGNVTKIGKSENESCDSAAGPKEIRGRDTKEEISNRYKSKKLYSFAKKFSKPAQRRGKTVKIGGNREKSASPSSFLREDNPRRRRRRNRTNRSNANAPTISAPTNFVHLSSATGPKCRSIDDTDLADYELMKITVNDPSPDTTEENRSYYYYSYYNGNRLHRSTKKIVKIGEPVPEVVKRLESIDDPTRSHEIAPVYEVMSEFSMNYSANTSFLWGKMAPHDLHRSDEEYSPIVEEKNRCSIDREKIDTYDDVVGLSPAIPDSEEDHYDDVGLPMSNAGEKSGSIETLFEEIRSDYDDVGPVERNLNTEGNPETLESVDSNDYTQMSARFSLDYPKINGKYPSIDNDYSSVEEFPVYDDVELPNQQDRVNSLYVSSKLGSINKESEWEDLDESVFIGTKKHESLRNADSQSSCGKKRLTQRRSRRTRRQRGKGSRKNPTSRATGIADHLSVAVSLGAGSVLLVGPNRPRSVESSQHPWETVDVKESSLRKRADDVPTSRGLVQLRILNEDSTIDDQETSCYVLEDTMSDDSNYETLFSSFPSDEFSSESEAEAEKIRETTAPSEINEVEAPSRPVPPPPRESSLTETFGKRMKLLRRTWSITKGSLGRMRRKSSNGNAPGDSPIDSNNKYANADPQQNDGRKYFSFKKHFRKGITGLSTFYLEMSADNSDRTSSSGFNTRNNNNNYNRGNNSKEEEINSSSGSDWYANGDWRSSRSDEDGDHYSMLDEEPLYQFYAAAAARVAFESDSEGYEEVEDPTPCSSDLAKSGNRTLWCQTPRIINSPLLQSLSSDERKIQEAKFEILTSEASYLNSLRVLVNEFLSNRDLIYEVLSPSEREKLFGGVPRVLVASERLLAELEAVWREDPMLDGLPELLANYAERSSADYVAYCSNQVSIDTTLKELRSRKGSRFAETIARIESHPACQSLSLLSFLMLPMQRVTRLPLLADAVLSKFPSEKEERGRWECALARLSQVVMECNEGARAAGRLAEMEALERKLEYSSKVPPIALRDRYLVRRGPVIQLLAKSDVDYKLTFGKKHHKICLYLLLLMDHLLIAKPKANANEEFYTVIDSCKRSLVALEKVNEDSPFAGRNAMILSLLENYSGRHVEYVLTCENVTERERWLDAISPPKPSLVGETLYETWDCPQVMALYSYAAAQPDELSLQPGDVINVLRKMTDGWHLGEKLLGGEQGWFPGNYAKEVASEHVRARNLRQRHRLLALSASVLQQRAKHTSR